MKQMIAIFVLALLPWIASAADDAALLPARIDQAIHARIKTGEYPALVIAVVDGKRSHVYAYGKLANGHAPDAHSVFGIGSITKTFTATLLAQAIHNGKLKADTPVAKLLPGFTIPTRNGKAITLENLATQHSGLPRLPNNLKPADSSNPYADYGGAQLKTFLAGYTLTRDPGKSYEYSNLGVGLLGYALAQQANSSYAALLNDQIFVPIGMASSAITLTDTMRAHLARGHDKSGKLVGNWSFAALAGAGAIKSTGADMLRYLKANMGVTKTPLASAMQLAQTPRADAPGGRIGLVWMLRHDASGDVLWHNGMTGGYASFLGFTVNHQHGVVILTNVQQSVDDLGFATLLPDAKLAPAHKQISMSAQQLDAYAGQYQLAPNFIIKLFRGDDQLYAQATGQSAFAIYPEAKNKFFANVADIQIEFTRDAHDNVIALVLHQNGHDSNAPKLTEAAVEKAQSHHAVKLDGATLQQYVGHYRLTPQAVFAITLDDGQLMAQLTGQPAFPITPSARDEFFYTAVDAQLSFKRDANGKVNALVLHQNGAERRAPRVSVADINASDG